MKKLFLLLFAGAGLFAAGFFIRDLAPESGGVAGRPGPVAGAKENRFADAGKAADQQAAGTDSAVRPFLPGRPFAKGHAREWLLELTSGFGGDRSGNAIAFAASEQSFMTMDDDSVRETLAALEELIAIEDAKNPERRRNPNGDGKLDGLMHISMLRLVQTNPAEALAMLKKNWNLNDGSTCLMVLGVLATKDPIYAEEFALGMEAKWRKDALKAVMYAQINKDPQAALDFAARHPEISDETYRSRIIEAWAKRDPNAAMAAAVKEMSASNNPEGVRKTIEEWAKQDPAAAALWANSYHGPGHVIAKAMILNRQAQEEPQAVLEPYAALQQESGDPRELSRLTSTLAGAYARKDVVAARTWAENLPDGDLRNRALREVASQWVKNDAPAASEWIRSLPPGELRDNSAKELSAAIASHDPADAFEWARHIQNSKMRQDALGTVMENWRKTDPEAASAALKSLPPEKP